MEVDYNLIDRYLSGGTTPEETVAVLSAIAVNPELEEYVIAQLRQTGYFSVSILV